MVRAAWRKAAHIPPHKVSEEDILDAAAIAWMRAWKYRRSYRPESGRSYKAWVSKILARVVTATIDREQARKRRTDPSSRVVTGWDMDQTLGARAHAHGSGARGAADRQTLT